jgi:uncharacterized membrane protein
MLTLQRLTVNGEWFSRFAERLARFLGTGTYLLWQSVFVVVWITLNLVGFVQAWDPYPFILLNLAFSTQAAYAAPLILLAQNRQDDRDRIALDEDRARAARTSADTEYLARELAALRLSVGELVTRDYLRDALERSASDGSSVDRSTRKALDKAVEKSVEKAVGRSVQKAVDQALEQALERARNGTRTEGGTSHGPEGDHTGEG